jgi:hypothetical protein
VSDRRAQLCPSAPANLEALLLGVVNGDGGVSYLQEPLPMDTAALSQMCQGRRPESRFRFASPCQRRACSNWGKGGCGVIDNVILDAGKDAAEGEAGPCGIWAQCMWYAQRGAEACRVCRLVVTNLAE